MRKRKVVVIEYDLNNIVIRNLKSFWDFKLPDKTKK